MIRMLVLKFFFIMGLSLSLTAYGNTIKTHESTVKIMTEIGNTALNHYLPEDGVTTMAVFSDLYFDYYEGKGMEVAVAALSPTSNLKTEALFTKLISAAGNSKSLPQLQTIWQDLQAQLHLDLALLKNASETHFIESFIQSLTILLREGFEALLIVTALVTYLRRGGHSDKTKTIYTGVTLAVIASIVTAIFFSTLFKNAGSQREAIEGIVMLFAALVMFYVSYWLFSKREADKWQQFIKQKMSRALSKGSLFALGLTAFLAVFREGAETILFYQALLMGNQNQMPAISLGFLTAIFVLFGIYWLMQKATYKIPFQLFFTLTAAFLYYMAFYFIGGGIFELQAAGWISASPIHGFPQIEWLGIFPNWENISAQLTFLIPTLGALLWWQIYRIKTRDFS